uniref:Uncharacterized protein n=1 Tax=Globisporangium ultimum (strain ATCC 200006 / CBS 805.95 / DAOM BR144) TaxID=431595 RepID=K3WWZ9_GLOUD
NDEAVVVTGTSNKATDFRATDESTTAAISPPASTPATVGEASPPSATLPSDTKASPRTPDPSDDEEKYTSSATGDTNGSTPRKQDSQTNGSGNGSSSRASDTASRGQLFWNPFFLLCASLLAIVGLVGSVVAYRAKQQRQMRHRMQQVAWHQHQARVRSLHRSTSSVSPGTRGDMYLVATTTRHGTPASATSTASPAQLATAPRTPFGIL